MKCHQKSSPRNPKRTKWVPNWCQNVLRSPKWRPVVKVSFFYTSLDGFRVPARLHFQPNPIKGFKKDIRKSTLEKYHQMIINSCKNTHRNYDNTPSKIWYTSVRQFLWFWNDYNVFLLFYHVWSVEKQSTILWNNHDRLPVVKKYGNKADKYTKWT